MPRRGHHQLVSPARFEARQPCGLRDWYEQLRQDATRHVGLLLCQETLEGSCFLRGKSASDSLPDVLQGCLKIRLAATDARGAPGGEEAGVSRLVLAKFRH